MADSSLLSNRGARNGSLTPNREPYVLGGSNDRRVLLSGPYCDGSRSPGAQSEMRPARVGFSALW